MSGTEGSVSAPHVTYPLAYQRVVALLMMLAYTLNSADRSLIAIIGQPMKVELGLSDTQLGLLVGTAFAALYAFSGVPVARLAERYNRVAIISTALIVWSGLTALCGVATSYLQLLALRVGVGVGEAGCTPPAHSLISDYVVPERRATALSFYSCGLSVGYILSAFVGGYVAMHYGWRRACVLIGLPGVLVALVIRRWVREPPRGNSEPKPGTDAAASAARTVNDRPMSVRGEVRELAAIARGLLARWPVANLVAGVTIATVASQGCWAFVPALFNRVFALDYATIGLVAGLAGGAAVGIGLVAGGVITDHFGARHGRWYALVPALGLAASVPLYLLAFVQVEWRLAAYLLAAAGLFQYLSFGPTFGVIQNVVGAHQRATATALIYVLLSVVGLGGGPLVTGWAIDRFAEFNFRHADVVSVSDSWRAMQGGASATDASFRTSCQGAGATATPAAQRAACAAALAVSSREGILVTVLLYAWASFHYLLGAIGLDRELRRHSTRSPP